MAAPCDRCACVRRVEEETTPCKRALASTPPPPSQHLGFEATSGASADDQVGLECLGSQVCGQCSRHSANVVHPVCCALAIPHNVHHHLPHVAAVRHARRGLLQPEQYVAASSGSELLKSSTALRDASRPPTSNSHLGGSSSLRSSCVMHGWASASMAACSDFLGGCWQAPTPRPHPRTQCTLNCQATRVQNMHALTEHKEHGLDRLRHDGSYCSCFGSIPSYH
jgi:hypothetical protein